MQGDQKKKEKWKNNNNVQVTSVYHNMFQSPFLTHPPIHEIAQTRNVQSFMVHKGQTNQA